MKKKKPSPKKKAAPKKKSAPKKKATPKKKAAPKTAGKAFAKRELVNPDCDCRQSASGDWFRYIRMSGKKKRMPPGYSTEAECLENCGA